MFRSVKFRYSKKDTQIWAIFHFIFDISSVKLLVEDGANVSGLLRISELYANFLLKCHFLQNLWDFFKMLNKCQFVKESQYRLHKCLMYVENLKPKSMSIKLNTSYLTDSYIVFTLKMESVSKFVDFLLFSKY